MIFVILLTNRNAQPEIEPNDSDHGSPDTGSFSTGWWVPTKKYDDERVKRYRQGAAHTVQRGDPTG